MPKNTCSCAQMAKRRTDSGPAAEVKPLTQEELPQKRNSMLQRRAHLCGSLRSKGLTPALCVVLARAHTTQCFKGPHTLAAQAGCSRVLARPAGLGFGFASLPRGTVGARCQYPCHPAEHCCA